MVIDVDILLQAQDLRVADIRAVNERAQKQERENRQDAISIVSPAPIRVASTAGDTNRTSIFLTTLFAAASSSTNRASALPRSSFSSCIFASILFFFRIPSEQTGRCDDATEWEVQAKRHALYAGLTVLFARARCVNVPHGVVGLIGRHAG
jgi:hypothetical protein